MAPREAESSRSEMGREKYKISRRSHRHPGESCFPEVFALHTAWIQDIRGEPVNEVLTVKKPKLCYEQHKVASQACPLPGPGENSLPALV